MKVKNSRKKLLLSFSVRFQIEIFLCAFFLISGNILVIDFNICKIAVSRLSGNFSISFPYTNVFYLKLILLQKVLR